MAVPVLPSPADTDLYRGFKAMISRMVFTISAVRAWQAATMTVMRLKKGSLPSQPTTVHWDHRAD